MSPRSLLRWFSLSLVLASVACARGTPEDGEGDAAVVDTGTERPDLDLNPDTSSVEDTGSVTDTGSLDTGGKAPDSGVPADTGTSELDTGVVADTGAGFDTGFARDTGTGFDTGFARDTGVADTGRADTGAADTGSPVEDVPPVDGGCPAGRTLCGGTCVLTASNPAHCGSCGRACTALPNAAPGCASGTCGLGTCTDGFGNCNNVASDGCEASLRGTPGACSTSVESLGAWCGDRTCGFLCGSTSFRAVATRTGRGSRWFRARITECSSCVTNLEHRIRLTMPAGVDYDLFVYSPCSRLVAQSRELAGVADTVTISQSDDIGGNDSADYYIEVRYYSGAACGNWTLTIDARATSATSC